MSSGLHGLYAFALTEGAKLGPRTDPRAGADDLTAKARIRNTAMDLYAEFGEERTSMRAIAAAAGVTVGLLVHHFKTKDGIRDAVEQLVVDHFAQAIEQAPASGDPRESASARDAAVEEMLESNPAVVNYLRRALLDPAGSKGQLLERLTDLTRTELAKARDAGLASPHRRDSTQIIDIMVRQLGQLFLQPMIDTMWDQVSGSDESGAEKPVLTVTVRDPDPH
ncbi:TetR/AcrR family transcriptional regulator (plasmid) [Rhodococcus sp. USK10]|uniref:TetR/AcrR family transcriptional regulator n=1 Tax=Rhodococcus sp. USK10 TaxID=2789739 RepID=UPI001C5DBACA|nr:TetR/AcrR family transcriptional regulator [Rhodococcus sp. USK10]QYA99619.1 TetR/AcrR family transcriptional regulator [Rhodococcus sp. USK10]